MGDRFINGFYNFLRPTLGTWLRSQYTFYGNNEKIQGLEPPFLVVSNHCLNWDPFLVSAYIPKAVRYIASDSLFRNRMLAFLLRNLVGAISKTKAMADSQTVKEAIRIMKRGGIVGVFPEANRTWDGKSIDIIYATAKLVKLARVPVVMCMMKGAYLSRPRWAIRGRKGPMFLDYYVLFTEKQTRELTVDEIYHSMNNAIYHDEYEWQKQHMHRYTSETSAEFLELFLYICPSCRTIGKLHSEKNAFTCLHCGLVHTLDDYGFFSGQRSFEHPGEWGDWQRDHIKTLLTGQDAVYADEGACLYSLTPKNKIRLIGKGTLVLYPDRIEFTAGKTGEKRVYEIRRIAGNTIQFNYLFEFYYEGVFHRFLFQPKNRVSAFKWNQAVQHIKNENSNERGNT
ncbi:MAG: lysophospholipid acyltransferase family protein [Clostridia bacterium]